MDDISREIRRYLRYLRRYWWLLLVGAAVGVAGMFGLNRLSSSDGSGMPFQRVVVVADRWPGLARATETGFSFAEDPETLSAAVARLSSESAVDAVWERFGIAGSDLSFAVEGRNVAMLIRADADVARDAAELLTRRLDQERVERLLAPIRLSASAIESRLEELSAELASADDTMIDARQLEDTRLRTDLALLDAAAAAVEEDVTSEILNQSLEQSGVQVSGRFSPFLALVGALAGLVVAAVAIVIWSVLDRRLSTRRDVEAVTGPGSLLAVVPRTPTDIELRAAAAAVEHLRSEHPDVALVAVGPNTSDVATSIAALTSSPCVAVDELFSDGDRAAYVPVAGSGAVTDAELERLQFVVERAGGGIAGVILVGGRNGTDLMD